MKKGLVLLFAVIASGITVMAQNNNKVKNDMPTKEQRIDAMTKRMSSSLMLNDSQNAKFVPLYKKYLSELEALRPQKIEKKEQIDDAQKDKMVREGFSHQRKMLNLQEKYYNDFTKFLSPSQAQKAIDSRNGILNKKNGMMKKNDRMMKKQDGMKGHKRMMEKKDKSKMNGNGTMK